MKLKGDSHIAILVDKTPFVLFQDTCETLLKGSGIVVYARDYFFSFCVDKAPFLTFLNSSKTFAEIFNFVILAWYNLFAFGIDKAPFLAIFHSGKPLAERGQLIVLAYGVTKLRRNSYLGVLLFPRENGYRILGRQNEPSRTGRTNYDKYSEEHPKPLATFLLLDTWNNIVLNVPRNHNRF